MSKKKRRRSSAFNNAINKMYLEIYLIYMYKDDWTLNNLQGLICHKTKTNEIKPYLCMYHDPVNVLPSRQGL